MNKNLLQIVIGALEERSHMGASLGGGSEDEKSHPCAQLWEGTRWADGPRGRNPTAVVAEA